MFQTMDGQKFCLKWDGFQSSVTSLFDSLRQVEELVDVTLCCEGHQVHAHRMMLSACSPYFRDLLKVGEAVGLRVLSIACDSYCEFCNDWVLIAKYGKALLKDYDHDT